jgi:hypothetical protein
MKLLIVNMLYMNKFMILTPAHESERMCMNM